MSDRGDIIDQANNQAEMLLNLQLKRRKPTIQAKGCCHNCDTPVLPATLFCDGECRSDWERREKM